MMLGLMTIGWDMKLMLKRFPTGLEEWIRPLQLGFFLDGEVENLFCYDMFKVG